MMIIALQKKRLKEAMQHMENVNFFSNRLNKTSLNFFSSQIKNQKRKPRGRRWTLDDKILGLSLLKQGPKAYKTLAKMFALPSRKSLLNLLQFIPLEAGINKPILNNLRVPVEKMDPMDRLCVVMFDEIFLDTNITFDYSKDSLVGFQTNLHDNREPMN